MSLAVRSVSVARGYDPRDFALVAFGGAGPLHAAEIARELHIPTVIVPRLPGHFSAFGMLLADLRHDYVRTYYKPLVDCDFQAMEAIFESMIREGTDLLASEGMKPEQIRYERFLDMRYVGQEFPIQTRIGADDLTGRDSKLLRAAFDRMHDRRYGHQATDEPVEVVNLRLTAFGRRRRSRLPSLLSGLGESTGRTAQVAPEQRNIVLRDAGKPIVCAIHDRESLHAGQEIAGPAVITEYASTTLLFEGDRLSVAASGELIIRIGEGA
jgi:N-methylhydantoinase A